MCEWNFSQTGKWLSGSHLGISIRLENNPMGYMYIYNDNNDDNDNDNPCKFQGNTVKGFEDIIPGNTT